VGVYKVGGGSLCYGIDSARYVNVVMKVVWVLFSYWWEAILRGVSLSFDRCCFFLFVYIKYFVIFDKVIER